MAVIFDALKVFFRRDTPVTPVWDGLLHGGLNPASRNELFYAELIEDKWDDRHRHYPLPPGWQG